jgi:hypothetical protein
MGDMEERVVIAPEQFLDDSPLYEHWPVEAATASAK